MRIRDDSLFDPIFSICGVCTYSEMSIRHGGVEGVRVTSILGLHCERHGLYSIGA
jgi:hypothetical protein